MRVEVSIGKVKGRNKIIKHGSTADNASVVKLQFNNMSEAEAKNIAQSRYHKYVYNGFTGDITGFGLPRTHAGDSLEIQNDREPEKVGVYLISKMVMEYSEEVGWARRNTLAYKVS